MADTIKVVDAVSGQIDVRPIEDVVVVDVQDEILMTDLPAEFDHIIRVPAANGMKRVAAISHTTLLADAMIPIEEHEALIDGQIAALQAHDVILDQMDAQLAAHDTLLDNLVAGKADINHTHPNATQSVAGFESAADKTKLDGIATGATANQTDSYLLNRANHTGTQAISTISGLQTALDSKFGIPSGGNVSQYLNGLGALQGRTVSQPARTIGVAFQPSTTRDVEVLYTIPVTSAATLVLGSQARGILRYADNAGMTTNVVTLPTDEFGVGSGLVVTAYGSLKLTGIIPAGKWVMITTTNVLGTPTYGTMSALETIL